MSLTCATDFQISNMYNIVCSKFSPDEHIPSEIKMLASNASENRLETP